MLEKCSDHKEMVTKNEEANRMFGRIEEYMDGTNKKLDALFELRRKDNDKIHALDLKIVGVANTLEERGSQKNNGSGFSFKANAKIGTIIATTVLTAVAGTWKLIGWLRAWLVER